MVYRFGLFREVVIDNGKEFLGFEEKLKDFGVRVIPTAPYNPQANSQVEGGHWRLLSAISKLAEDDPHWLQYLDRAVLADRVAVRHHTGQSPFFLIHGWEPLLPIEVEIPTWRLINWDEVHTQEELLYARMRILERKIGDVAAASAKVADFRMDLKQKRDIAAMNRMRGPLEEKDLVLVYDMVRIGDLTRKAKVSNRWRGPYRIHKVHPSKTSYRLEELDGAVHNRVYRGSMLKKFIKNEDWWICADDEEIIGAASGKSLRTATGPRESFEAPSVHENDEPPPPETNRRYNLRARTLQQSAKYILERGEPLPGDFTIEDEMDNPSIDQLSNAEIVAAEEGEGDEPAQGSIQHNKPWTKATIEVHLPGMTAEEKEEYRSQSFNST